MTAVSCAAKMGGFFASEQPAAARGALAPRRKPFQDAPTPAADPAAAIALLRLHAYTNDAAYREQAQTTLEVFAGMAEQYGMFAGTYGIAAQMFSQPHVQVIILERDLQDALAEKLHREAVAGFALNQTVLRLPISSAVGENLPPSVAETIPNLPAVKQGQTCAIVCSNFACQPPIRSEERR